MKKLDLSNLSPYLPHELIFERKGTMYTLIGLMDGYVKSMESDFDWFRIEDIKIALRPISDFNKTITIHGRTFTPIEEIKRLISVSTHGSIEDVKIFTKYQFGMYGVTKVGEEEFHSSISYDIMSKLFEWHFDVFRLIEADIAFDTNSR